jgi:hypothetical protein
MSRTSSFTSWRASSCWRRMRSEDSRTRNVPWLSGRDGRRPSFSGSHGVVGDRTVGDEVTYPILILSSKPDLTPAGKLMFQIMGAFAEVRAIMRLERSVTRMAYRTRAWLGTEISGRPRRRQRTGTNVLPNQEMMGARSRQSGRRSLPPLSEHQQLLTHPAAGSRRGPNAVDPTPRLPSPVGSTESAPASARRRIYSFSSSVGSSGYL